MFKGFLKHIQTIIEKSDVLFEVLDARYPEETRNIEIEKQVKMKRKKLVLLINKSDLVSKEFIEEKKKELEKKTRLKTIFVSSKNKEGINLIRKEISLMNKEQVVIGIIGYPNTGKSSLINAIAGKGKGRVATSKKAGFTRGLQKIRISNNAYILDSPGIIPRKKSESELFLVNSKNINQLKDIEGTTLKIIQEVGLKKISDYFGVNSTKNPEELLEIIAFEKNLLKKGGIADTTKSARLILKKYQENAFI